MAKNSENYQITKNLNESRLREICQFFKNRNLQELTLVEGDMEITLKASIDLAPTSQTVTSHVIETSAPEPKFSPPVVEKDSSNLEGHAITATISGTYYASPSPKDPPFIKVGDKLKKGDKVCIIEAMKVMNEISSPFSGTVASILTSNSRPVKQGETLIIIK